MHGMCGRERDETPEVCGARQQKKPEILYIVTFMKIKLLTESKKSGLLPPLLEKRELTLMLAPRRGVGVSSVLSDCGLGEASSNGYCGSPWSGLIHDYNQRDCNYRPSVILCLSLWIFSYFQKKIRTI